MYNLLGSLPIIIKYFLNSLENYIKRLYSTIFYQKSLRSLSDLRTHKLSSFSSFFSFVWKFDTRRAFTVVCLRVSVISLKLPIKTTYVILNKYYSFTHLIRDRSYSASSMYLIPLASSVLHQFHLL